MSSDDAFESEMDRNHRINDAVAEALITGADLGDQRSDFEATALFLRALPAAIQVAPASSSEAVTISALADAGRIAALEADRGASPTAPFAPVRGSGWRGRLALLGAVIALLPLLTAGLAFAGVDLPEPVDEAFERVGIELPNQADGGDAASRGREGAKGLGAEDPAGAASGDRGAGTEQPDDHKGGKPHAGGPSVPGSGKGNGPKGRAQGSGPKGVPPGHGGVPPGQGGDPPGNLGVPPGGGSDGTTGPPPDPGSPPAAGPPVQGGAPPGQAKPK